MKMPKLIGFIFITVIVYFIGYSSGIGNQSPKYGDSGLPKNCRALIASNLTGYHGGTYEAEEVLESIERNCGPYGYIWNER